VEETGVPGENHGHDVSHWQTLSHYTWDKLCLSNWGLPESVLNQYHSKGITSMFEWQAECLCTGNTLSNNDYI
jgi:hypothetical protein